MLKRGIANERIEISSKEFTKKFIKNFILNGLAIGLFFGLIYELITYFITNSVVKEIISFVTIFFAINKIHVAAIKNTFYDSYILGDNIRKSKNNVMIFFIVIALINIILNVIPAIKMCSIASSFFGTLYLKRLITQNVINTVLYVIIIIFCRDEIDKQCSEFNSDKKNYLIKNIILVFIFAVVVIVGTFFINSELKNLSNIKQDENSNLNNVNKENANTLSNEINLKLIKEADGEYTSYNAKNDSGEIELNICSFETEISKSDYYMLETVNDGILVFYSGTEKNHIEKFDTKGNSKWKKATSSQYKFSKCIEVSNGYFIVGTYLNSKDFITKIDKEGNLVNSQYIEEDLTNLSPILFIQSEKDIYEGCAKIIGINKEGKNVIIEYDNKGNQKNILYTKLTKLVCEKVIEKNGYYYGICANSAQLPHERREETLFKLDSNGNKVFAYSILENSRFSEYVNNYSMISEITVNSNFIFISISDDIYILDLNGDLKEKIPYTTDNELNKGSNNVSIGQIMATDEGIYILGMLHSKEQYTSPMFIDKISNNFNLEYRINVPYPEESNLKTGIYGWKLIGRTYTHAKFYDDCKMVVHQYKLY